MVKIFRRFDILIKNISTKKVEIFFIVIKNNVCYNRTEVRERMFGNGAIIMNKELVSLLQILKKEKEQRNEIELFLQMDGIDIAYCLGQLYSITELSNGSILGIGNDAILIEYSLLEEVIEEKGGEWIIILKRGLKIIIKL